MGGHDGMSIFNSVERFNPETAKWEHVKPMRSRRCRLGACALNGKLYVCGGFVAATPTILMHLQLIKAARLWLGGIQISEMIYRVNALKLGISELSHLFFL